MDEDALREQQEALGFFRQEMIVTGAWRSDGTLLTQAQIDREYENGQLELAQRQSELDQHIRSAPAAHSAILAGWNNVAEPETEGDTYQIAGGQAHRMRMNQERTNEFLHTRPGLGNGDVRGALPSSSNAPPHLRGRNSTTAFDHHTRDAAIPRTHAPNRAPPVPFATSRNARSSHARDPDYTPQTRALLSYDDHDSSSAPSVASSRTVRAPGVPNNHTTRAPHVSNNNIGTVPAVPNNRPHAVPITRAPPINPAPILPPPEIPIPVGTGPGGALKFDQFKPLPQHFFLQNAIPLLRDYDFMSAPGPECDKYYAEHPERLRYMLTGRETLHRTARGFAFLPEDHPDIAAFNEKHGTMPGVKRALREAREAFAAEAQKFDADKTDEAKKAAEDAKRLADEQKAAEDAKKRADEQEAADAAQKAAEDKKAAEAAMRLADEKKAAETAKKFADEKKAAEAAKKLADELEKEAEMKREAKAKEDADQRAAAVAKVKAAAAQRAAVVAKAAQTEAAAKPAHAAMAQLIKKEEKELQTTIDKNTAENVGGPETVQQLNTHGEGAGPFGLPADQVVGSNPLSDGTNRQPATTAQASDSAVGSSPVTFLLWDQRENLIATRRIDIGIPGLNIKINITATEAGGDPDAASRKIRTVLLGIQ